MKCILKACTLCSPAAMVHISVFVSFLLLTSVQDLLAWDWNFKHILFVLTLECSACIQEVSLCG